MVLVSKGQGTESLSVVTLLLCLRYIAGHEPGQKNNLWFSINRSVGFLLALGGSGCKSAVHAISTLLFNGALSTCSHRKGISTTKAYKKHRSHFHKLKAMNISVDLSLVIRHRWSSFLSARLTLNACG